MSNGINITRHRYYTYNANGQLTGRTLPGNMTYGYTYDAYGNLTGVNGAGGAVQWSLADYTGRRTVSNTVLNGYTAYQFATTHLLDQYGYLDSIKTCQNNEYFQLDDYNFSPVMGNLMSVNNRMSDGEVWTFVYDNVDRLTKVRENNQDIMEMTYAANGNITSKTGIGSYTYNHSKPHAVDTVSNTSGKLPSGDMYVTYNNWGKMSSVWYNGPADFYSYSVGYGPDMQRVTSEMHKTYQKQYEKFYWDDYEEKVIGTDTLHYYYVYGADGLAGLHIVKTGPNIQTTTSTTKVITDHLGSIISLIDVSDWVYDVQYDVWGNREVMLTYDFDPTFDRGYTGHEHLEWLGLINMNGRMYDPQLGRFLSPDPFIQTLTNPQNYNRYSYCLNNPLKYTDPDGEFFTALTVFCPALLPIGIAMDIGWMQGAHKASYYPNVSTFEGACRGALSGAIGGALSMVGGGTLVANILWGGAEGSITGAVDAALWGEDINRAALNGAIMGASFASFNSLIEASRNCVNGNGFGTSEGLTKHAFKHASRQEAIEKMQDVYGMRIDLKTGKNVKMTYDGSYTDEYGKTNLFTGDITIGPLAYESFDEFKATIVHEYAHSTLDRVLDANGIGIGWKYNKYSVKGIDSPLFKDGPLGYANEINNGGILQIKPSYFLNPDNNLMWDIWSKEAGSKWGYIIPSRYNHTVSIIDYPF